MGRENDKSEGLEGNVSVARGVSRDQTMPGLIGHFQDFS